MQISIAPGRYVIAVSGGVDSMALLHATKSVSGIELIVAHFDHGIRPDSQLDCNLVKKVAGEYGLKFEYEVGKLGPAASEAKARTARYEFLKSVKSRHQALAIITAHHLDDVLETAVLNLSRGTGWRGLISLNNNEALRRPLLDISKPEILEYAIKHNLVWLEDMTNSDEKYLRNYIRRIVMPQFSTPDRQELAKIIRELRVIGDALAETLTQTLKLIAVENELERSLVRNLPEEVLREILIAWWRQNGFYGYESKTVTRAINNILANKSGTIVPLKGNLGMSVGRTKLALIRRER